MANTYYSKYTGAEIDAGIQKTNAIPAVVDAALEEAKLSGAFTGADGYTPVKGVDYYTDADKAEFSTYIASELAKKNQIIPAYAESVEWLEESGDQSKLYVLPDGMTWAYMMSEKEVEDGETYINRLPEAKAEDRTAIYGADYNGDTINDGYLTGYRLSSSGTNSTLDGACVSGFIAVKPGDIVRIKGATPILGTSDCYVITYKSDNTKVAHKQLPKASENTDWSTNANTNATYNGYYNYTDGVITITLNDNFGTDFDAIRFSAGTISADTIVTVNQEIREGGGTIIVIEEGWASTGHALVPADYEDRIIDLEQTSMQHTANIAALKKGFIDTDGLDAISWIREWDAPIYDRTPVWELSNEKSALTSSDKTVAAVYAKYDALMAAHPDFITKTDLGLASDDVTHVYRYDFKERESRHQSGFEWSEKKPKFIVVTGIHREWNGIYSMFNALSEIATNDELAELRRSVHFIVIPVLNPYSISGLYDTVGHCANANGVEIHRNFEVGFSVSGENTIHYTGAAPLSEVESLYLDDILKNNTDAAYFLTCHSFDRDKTWGVGFLWGSSATKYMCNMAFRVIDKMGKAWHKKYGKAWEDGIKAANDYVLADPAQFPNAKPLDANDYRIGHAALTNTGGCEQRQATKYGIQATNFEVGETFFVLDETMLSAKAVTHGTEAYVNFFLAAMNEYDPKDKKEYWVN